MWGLGPVDELVLPLAPVVVLGLLGGSTAALLGDLVALVWVLGMPLVSGVRVLVSGALVPVSGLVPRVREVAGVVTPVVSSSASPSSASAGIPGGVLAVGAVLARLA